MDTDKCYNFAFAPVIASVTEVGYVVVHLTVVQIGDREAEAGILDERCRRGVVVDVVGGGWLRRGSLATDKARMDTDKAATKPRADRPTNPRATADLAGTLPTCKSPPARCRAREA